MTRKRNGPLELRPDEPHPHEFLKEDPWRVFRIMSEFVEGFEAMNRLGPAVSELLLFSASSG